MTPYPKLRSDIVAKRLVLGGEVAYVVKLRETRQYLRFSEHDWAIISLFDGQSSYEEMAARLNKIHPGERMTAGDVEDSVHALKKKGLVERSAAEQSQVILEKLQAERKKRAEQSQARDLFNVTVAHFNPERVYNRIHRRLRWIWTREFVIATLAMFAVAAIVIQANWHAVREGMLSFWALREKTGSDIALLFCILAIVIIIHESAHALTCINFGGEVNELGFMLMYFIPAFYANVSDAYLFEKKWHKYWVTLAGGYSELIICSLAVFTWALSQPGTFLNHLAYTTMVFAGISTILFNYNPLMKLDGYYLLTDILEVTNLRENSFAYLTYLVKTRIFRAAVDPPRWLTPRKKRIYLTYSLFSAPYSIFVVTMFLLFMYRTFTKNFPEAGLFLFFIAAFLILRKRVRKLMVFSRFVYLDKRAVLSRRASVRRAALAAGLALLALFLYPSRHTVTGEVVLEPGRHLPLRAETAGVVTEVASDTEPVVPAGTIVARLQNDELRAHRQRAQAEVARLTSEAARALATGDSAAYQARLREQQRAQEELRELIREESQLEIRAPFSGRILSGRLEDLLGKHLEPGDLISDFGGLDPIRARVMVSEFDFRELQEGQKARLKVNSYAADTFSGTVTRRAMASTDTYDASGRSTGLVRRVYAAPGKQEGAAFARFELVLEIANSGEQLRPGMAGRAKIETDRHMLVTRIFRSVRDTLRSKVWW